MASPIALPVAPFRAVRRLQVITIIWMTIELAVALVSAMRAHSVALFAFGGDSAIELFSAGVVLVRFSGIALSERHASRIAAWLLIALAAFIALASMASLLYPALHPESSFVGIALLLAATVVMPWLARQKRLLAAQTGSSALKADATQSAVCAYLAWIALGGLALNALFHLDWADPVAALALTPLVVYEAREAWRGQVCACH